MTSSTTAGRGDPYWYEWFVGLIEVVDLLDPSSGVVAVAFQKEGIKGWDDVVVRMNDGSRRCYQVKNTRAGNTLTFGDLVQLDENQNSLLSTLFDAWRDDGLNDGHTRCILYTNREAGTRVGITSAGIERPPLLDFIEWLNSTLGQVSSIDEIIPPESWEAAWREWRSQLVNGSDAERLTFLRSFEIRTDQDDLDGLVDRVSAKLEVAFGINSARVAPLFDALHRALRTWTTRHAEITVEHLYSELALPPEPNSLAPAPQPPAPFFPTRIPVADDIQTLLQSADPFSVIFLTGDPGSGKTSVLSWLANRRADIPFDALVGLRFFCFEPIRPESPFIAPDASRVRPDDLWFSLLTQLREGLRGRLREMAVPIRNELLNWQEARQHVLRLASEIGSELGRRFIIVVDGIDHAARAAQTNLQQARDFLSSLPSPDELSGTCIRFLVAGQPPQSYAAEYQSWLRDGH